MAVLERARTIGLLGRSPVEEHVEHAHALAACVPTPPASFLDLGSGAGVPGLVLALLWPESGAVLLDAQHKRVVHLRAAVVELGLSERCTVVTGGPKSWLTTRGCGSASTWWWHGPSEHRR